MKGLLWMILVIDLASILLILSLRLDEYNLSSFAFNKYLEQNKAKNLSQKKNLYKNIAFVKAGLLLKLVALFTLSVTLWVYLVGPLLGFTYALFTLLGLSLVSRIGFIQAKTKVIFEYDLEIILKVVKFFSPVLKLIRPTDVKGPKLPESFDEFIDQLHHISAPTLNSEQRNRIELVLSSQKKTVKDIMTPSKRVITVEPSVTIGPIVLSDLLKTKHGYFLVSVKKGEPEGVLKLSDISDINQAKRSISAKDFMTTSMSYIEQDAPLDQLIQVFLEEKEYILIVKNSDDQYVGIVTIADIFESLIGVSLV